MPDQNEPAIVTVSANDPAVVNGLPSYEYLARRQITGLRLRRLPHNVLGLLSVERLNVSVVLEVRVSEEFQTVEGGKTVAAGVRETWHEVPVVDDENGEGFGL